MRWALVKVCLAVTAMVVVAFAIPLALVVKEMARDRAMSNAERKAAAIGPALAITTDRDALRRAVATAHSGDDGRLAVHVPAAPSQREGAERSGDSREGAGQRGEGATEARPAVHIGRSRVSSAELRTASKLGRSSLTKVPGGYALLQPTVVDDSRTAVVEVYVPDGDITKGVAISWAVLAGVGISLMLGSMAIADRLGTRLVTPAKRLASAAHDLGEGDLDVRVEEEGPAELRSAAVAFNSMADQVVQLLANERELAADLSHRLRTPLTVLRLNAASLGDGDDAVQTREVVAQLEREVDRIIRTAREQRAPSQQVAGAQCDAAEVIRERMEFWSALAEDEGREARLAGCHRPVRVPVSRGDLVAAMDAMLGNVFRHTPEGTAFSVDVHHTGVTSNSVIILVSDAGPGIADPDTALRRGHGDGGPGSTGLGLDIVRRVAESTGGDVRIGRSVLGGSEVRMWLNLNRKPPSGRGDRRGNPRRHGRG
ncbi:HAMP domain-containing sensor histidine kinase [Streptomyces sp. NPDC005438]|uniref:sensor histidine kinase n=1 Tax=Streptomyces sp. NPDC005438 TaxID=3156880 RepID=UPI0033A9327C